MNAHSIPLRSKVEIFFTQILPIFLIFSFVGVLIWSQTDNQFRTWILVGGVVMVFFLLLTPLLFGLGKALIFFVLSTIVLFLSISAAHYSTTLSEKGIDGLSLSSCAKDRLLQKIQKGGAIDKEGLGLVEEECTSAPLSGQDLALMSFSACEKNRLYLDIKGGMLIDRKNLMSIKSLCEKESKAETTTYKKEELMGAKKKADLANDQLKALGFSN